MKYLFYTDNNAGQKKIKRERNEGGAHSEAIEQFIGSQIEGTF